MRKLAVSDYAVKARNQDGAIVDAPYNVKESLVTILFHPALKLEARELLRRDKLANKILDCKDGMVLLEEAEWQKLETAVNTISGYSRADIELVRRVLEAEQVEVAEKSKR